MKLDRHELMDAIEWGRRRSAHPEKWDGVLEELTDGRKEEERYPVVVHAVWIPVTEALPEDGVRVLACTVTKKGKQNLVLAYWDGTTEQWAAGFNSNVTHWMPLPEPPVG